MAYTNFLAVIPHSQVIAFREGAISLLTPVILTSPTHALVSFLEDKELREAVAECLDGGEVFDDRLWHPLRAPRLHSAKDADVRGRRLRMALEAFLPKIPEAERQWYQIDIDPILQVFDLAAGAGYSVVSALEPPVDRDRADKVVIPFDYPKRKYDSRGSMTTPIYYRLKPALLAPLVVCGVGIALAFVDSPWWLLSIPCAVYASLCAQPNLNLADGCVAYFMFIVGFAIIYFHRPSGIAICFGTLASFCLSALEKRLTAKPVFSDLVLDPASHPKVEAAEQTEMRRSM